MTCSLTLPPKRCRACCIPSMWTGTLRLREVKPLVHISSPSLSDSRAQLSPTAPQVIIPWCPAEVPGGTAMAPRSQSKSMWGQGSPPQACAGSCGSPRAVPRGLPSCAADRSIHLTSTEAGDAQGHRAPPALGATNKVTRIRGEIFIHSGRAARAPRRAAWAVGALPVTLDYLQTPRPLSMLSPLSIPPMPTLLP